MQDQKYVNILAVNFFDELVYGMCIDYSELCRFFEFLLLLFAVETDLT